MNIFRINLALFMLHGIMAICMERNLSNGSMRLDDGNRSGPRLADVTLGQEEMRVLRLVEDLLRERDGLLVQQKEWKSAEIELKEKLDVLYQRKCKEELQWLATIEEKTNEAGQLKRHVDWLERERERQNLELANLRQAFDTTREVANQALKQIEEDKVHIASARDGAEEALKQAEEYKSKAEGYIKASGGALNEIKELKKELARLASAEEANKQMLMDAQSQRDYFRDRLDRVSARMLESGQTLETPNRLDSSLVDIPRPHESDDESDEPLQAVLGFVKKLAKKD